MYLTQKQLPFFITCLVLTVCPSVAAEQDSMRLSDERSRACTSSVVFLNPKNLAILKRFHEHPPEKEKDFWKWFGIHEFELMQAKIDSDPVIGELKTQLRKVNPSLIASLGWTDEALVPDSSTPLGMEPFQARQLVNFSPGRRKKLSISCSECSDANCLSAQLLVLSSNLEGQTWQQNDLCTIQLGDRWIIGLGPHPRVKEFVCTALASRVLDTARCSAMQNGDRIDFCKTTGSRSVLDMISDR